jgi:TM2 domain-containing membrane protein YozV
MKNEYEIWLNENQSLIDPDFLPVIIESLENIDDEDFEMLLHIKLRNPKKIQLLAIFLGQYALDRFLLHQPLIGVIKLFTLGGFGILWIFDIFTAKNRTKEYNAREILDIINPNGYSLKYTEKETAKKIIKTGFEAGKDFKQANDKAREIDYIYPNS